MYLALVTDLFARKVFGWSMKPTLARELVLDAILMAVWSGFDSSWIQDSGFRRHNKALRAFSATPMSLGVQPKFRIGGEGFICKDFSRLNAF